eukprot:TRINITY_DN55219_c0_g1_i1.p1 TRINITY_DN55219_c0_g1~~TRINITY_DN55219_c0_g1_i1.p1  ORF type:complete len:515 (-),score=94.37 TRINITY_DN55219_c0_g1_i1:107-1552(-)
MAVATTSSAPSLERGGMLVGCRGVTQQGVRCRWTTASSGPEAAPLRNGAHFCIWHLPKRTPHRLDPGQKLILSFFPLARRSGVAVEDCVVTLASPATPPREFSRTQLERIAENRSKALARRQQRLMPEKPEVMLEQDMLSTATPSQTKTQSLLTCDQAKRIADNRAKALERRLQRQSRGSQPKACEKDVVAAPTPIRTEDCNRCGSFDGSPTEGKMSVPGPPPPPPLTLTEAELERIAQNRFDAIMRRQRREQEVRSAKLSEMGNGSESDAVNRGSAMVEVAVHGECKKETTESVGAPAPVILARQRASEEVVIEESCEIEINELVTASEPVIENGNSATRETTVRDVRGNENSDKENASERLFDFRPSIEVVVQGATTLGGRVPNSRAEELPAAKAEVEAVIDRPERSRTPVRRPRRTLMPRLTASPLPMPRAHRFATRVAMSPGTPLVAATKKVFGARRPADGRAQPMSSSVPLAFLIQ